MNTMKKIIFVDVKEYISTYNMVPHPSKNVPMKVILEYLKKNSLTPTEIGAANIVCEFSCHASFILTDFWFCLSWNSDKTIWSKTFDFSSAYFYQPDGYTWALYNIR